ncbi:unnamed protein product [Leuciscus chuanchicus]
MRLGLVNTRHTYLLCGDPLQQNAGSLSFPGWPVSRMLARVLNILLTGGRCLWGLAAGPGCCRAGAAFAGHPRHRAGGAWALGGLKEDPYRGKLCLIASVYFFNTENCCESSTVSPNRPPWEMGASRIFSERLSQRWHSWTIARPRACAITFIVRRA